MSPFKITLLVIFAVSWAFLAIVDVPDGYFEVLILSSRVVLSTLTVEESRKLNLEKTCQDHPLGLLFTFMTAPLNSLLSLIGFQNTCCVSHTLEKSFLKGPPFF